MSPKGERFLHDPPCATSSTAKAQPERVTGARTAVLTSPERLPGERRGVINARRAGATDESLKGSDAPYVSCLTKAAQFV